jgi:tRNA uridine 5-carboxymethylaminomethyl modification enzyme
MITQHADALRQRRVFPSVINNQALVASGLDPISHEGTAAEILARPTSRYQQLQQAFDLPPLPDSVVETLEIEIKYGGYLVKQQRQVARVQRMERLIIPANLPMTHLSGMRNEARQVLQRAQPATIGQASRLAGMTPADISLLILAIEKQHTVPNDTV